MTRSILLAVLMSFVVASCAKQEPAAQSGDSGTGGKSPAGAKQSMAYERSLTLEAADSQVASLHKTAESLCRQAVEAQCVILESQLSGGPQVSASLKVRAKPEGIGMLMERLGTQGKVLRQSVTGEDLAEPIADSAKKLEILSNYRSRLESLGGKAGADIETLMKLNRELAEVQGQIEALSGEYAFLVRRVETEVLTISIYSAGSAAAAWSPISSALNDFGSNLSEAVGALITATSFVLPWLLLLSLMVWGVRKWWPRRKRPSSDP